MSSWPRKIYLLFWVSLIALTGLGAYIVPRILDGSQSQGYHEIDGQGRPPLPESLSGSVSTSFPVRPFLDAKVAASTAAPEREAFPTSRETPIDEDRRGSGLPQRDASGPGRGGVASTPAPSEEAVTTRATVAENASVFESPRTTALVLGTVAPGTQVRWLRNVEPGWEEILLRDGRSVYMATSALSFSGSVSSDGPVDPAPSNEDSGDRVGDAPASTLPSTVEGFLGTLKEGDLLRASTYLAPTAPPLEEPDLGVWSSLVGGEVSARVGRIEPVTGKGSEWRSVLISDEKEGGAREIATTWEWDSRQERWLLVSWQ